MAESTVENKITIKEGEGQTKLVQKFTMTSAEKKPLMTFSVNGKQIGSITSKFLLTLKSEVVKALPPEIKKALAFGEDDNLLKIEPIKDGVCPIEIDAKNNELKVHIKAKDGSKIYECRINATGVYLNYDGNESSYTPNEVDGKPQAIDVTMSTKCFERMLDKDNPQIKLAGVSKTENITPKQVPAFMLGTYLEATKQEAETAGENNISEDFSSFTLSLPNKVGTSAYHFVKNEKNGQVYAFHSGSLKPIHSFAIFTTRDEDGNVKSPYLKMNVGTKTKPVYAYIDLPKSEGENAVDPKFLDAVAQIKEYFGDSVTFPAAESGKSVIGKDSKGNEIYAEWASSDDERKFETKVKGKTFTFSVEPTTLESGDTAHSVKEGDELSPAAKVNEKTSAVMDESSEEKDTPTPVKKEDPVATEKSGKERLQEETPFASTPMKSVDMSKVKSKISPDWGVNMMLAGMVLMLVGLLLGPALAAVFACVGVAVTAGGGWLAVNADRLANPYLKIEQYIIDPLKKKERASEKEREAHWEKTKELSAASANAEMTKGNLLDTKENLDAKFWNEIFGKDYEDFISDGNLLKRKAFLEELQLINNASGDEKAKMIDAFKIRYGLSEDGLNNLLGEEKAEAREKALAAMRKLNQEQEDVHKKQMDMIENAKQLNEFTFKKICEDMKSLSPEARKEAMEQNKYAIAMHLMSQNHLSQAATEQILAVLPEDCHEALTGAITEIAKMSTQVDAITLNAANRTKDHQKTRDYAETMKEIDAKNSSDFGSPTKVGEAALSYIVANSTDDMQIHKEIEAWTFGHTDFAKTITDSIITVDTSDTTPNSLGGLLKEQRELLTTKIGLRTLGEAVLTDGLKAEVVTPLDNSADSLEALHSRSVEKEKVDMLYALRHLPTVEDNVDIEAEFNEIDSKIEKAIAESINLDELEKRVNNIPSAAKASVAPEVLDSFMKSDNLKMFSEKQRKQLALLYSADIPELGTFMAAMALDGTLIPAIKAHYILQANGMSEADTTDQGKQRKAMEVQQQVENYESTQKTMSRLTEEELEKINAKNPESFSDLKKAVEDVVGQEKRDNVDGKTIADAVKEGLVKDQKDIKLGIDKQAEQELLTIESKVGKDQTKVLTDTAVQALKKQNNITDTQEIGKIQELKQGKSVEDDITAKESRSSKSFHKQEEKHDSRTELRKEGIEKLVEIMAMPDDTGKERITALSEYIKSFPVGEATPFDAPDFTAKGFNLEKWVEKTVEQVKSEQELDDKDIAEMVANMAGFKRVTSHTTSAKTIAKNAATFTEATKEKAAETKEEPAKLAEEEVKSDKSRNPFKLKGPAERED